MGFQFSYVCDLLQRLEDAQRAAVRSTSTTTTPRTNNANGIISEWFRGHQTQLARDGQVDTAALLSTLLPEKRTDRVYLIREKKLQTIIGRGLFLGRSRILELERWTVAGSGVDLADCVSDILTQTPSPPSCENVTVEEIDDLLHSIAAGCRFSSPAVRSSAPSERRLTDNELALGDLYRRLTARDAKWLTRLILKNFEPVVLDPQTVYRSCHPLLPAILQVQDDFTVVGATLARQRHERTVTGRANLADYLKPALGVKVGRQPWIKGRSIKHCLDMSLGRMSCEEKVDGEYCQIHIDLSKDRDCIQIFSKSGKDSTNDRMSLHDSIRQSLQLGQTSCPLKKGCILEGELVVYSDKDTKILDFHKIRKHVSRSGTFIRTDQDSQRHSWEHLMIVYYDLLMVDDESLLAVRQSERFQRLKDLVTIVPGRSVLVKREIIDCTKRSAASDLRRAFARCITSHGEGLVLKQDDPYFNFDTSRKPYSCCAIKLKKDYIGHFGDIGDFAVVGARYDATKAKTYGIPNLKWTHFYVGCLENKDEVERFHKPPKFVVTNVVELNVTQLKMFVTFVNPQSVAPEENKATYFRVEMGVDNGKRPSAVFPVPPVFDLRCFSFDMVGNTGFCSPRFPMVNKIHCDRTYRDALSFAELQEMAIRERELPPPEDSQELLGWIAALEAADPKGTVSVDESSQSTVATLRRCETPLTQSSQTGLPTSPPRLGIPVTGNGPPTLPKSSAVEALVQTPLNGAASSLRGPQGQKRPHESTVPSTTNRRKARKSDNDYSTTSAIVSQKESRNAASLSNDREPLTDIRVNSSRRNNVPRTANPSLGIAQSMYQLSSEDNPRLSAPERAQTSIISASMSFQGVFAAPQASSDLAGNVAAVIRKARSQSEGNSRERRIDYTSAEAGGAAAAAGKCRYLPTSCTLAPLLFLLSPCIADFPWVTEDLLRCHGIVDFARDPKTWPVPKRLNSRAIRSTTDPSASSRKGKNTPWGRKKRAVLVDARRKEATEAFLKCIVDAQLKGRDGKKEYVDVYDWRVLEALKREEEQVSRNGERPDASLSSSMAQGIWRKFWVGLA
ncbi:hypothetical protein B0H63DRAFT_248675 [Podospora didyma]|uniref:ATP-dependent DNA ligase family profile domain-containing protein n=1 Tax=Podospora didyma TaxID=330526 RepID=A0AAE0KL45_9PEZI|nr:hypothetical protein B0H63DRAFT_248675 [Podospora didyma]